ncbi:prenyltransferase/squalene oxidase repeat-containing protein [Pseudalkalibacillus hwajinpoensis]|uniref:terpene cyclase/mutase family protein n=1 Tax=Guptibacillus hwajinpoensis TaxID=208199 RepID=UPI00325BE677
MDNMLEERIGDLIQKALSSQSDQGAFKFCFENSIVTDSMMIVLIRTLELSEERLLEQLVHRLLDKQSRGGYWKLSGDDEGNLSTTVQAYHSLLFSGMISRHDERMKKAERYIQKWGGMERTDTLTKIFLALNGHIKWPRLCHFPMLFMLLPESFPVSFYDLSSYARVHFAPIILAQDYRYSIKTRWTPDLSHLQVEERILGGVITSAWDAAVQFPSHLIYHARKRAEQYMLQRIEADGTLFNYATATFFMIYAMLAIGYERHSNPILNAMNGLKGMFCLNESHLQNSPSTIWDSALLSYVLQEAGMAQSSPSILKVTYYLLQHQQTKPGDWADKRPNVSPGGWGFSEGNTTHPDVDDTTAALRAITVPTLMNPGYQTKWQNGFNWVIAMQNKDGGWPAFEPDRKALLLKDLPIDGAQSSFPDDSTADLTGRTLEFLCNYAGLKMGHPSIQMAINWLVQHQERDGSWYGRWGVCYIYGTWAAITGLKASGVANDHPAIEKGIAFLKRTQSKDGGWGESCQSYEKKRFISLSHSTLSQTAWAVDALTVCQHQGDVLKRGVEYLLKDSFTKEERTYPTGAGLPGSFYIYYHSYEIIWPLLALVHYRKLSEAT